MTNARTTNKNPMEQHPDSHPTMETPDLTIAGSICQAMITGTLALKAPREQKHVEQSDSPWLMWKQMVAHHWYHTILANCCIFSHTFLVFGWDTSFGTQSLDPPSLQAGVGANWPSAESTVTRGFMWIYHFWDAPKNMSFFWQKIPKKEKHKWSKRVERIYQPLSFELKQHPHWTMRNLEAVTWTTLFVRLVYIVYFVACLGQIYSFLPISCVQHNPTRMDPVLIGAFSPFLSFKDRVATSNQIILTQHNYKIGRSQIGQPMSKLNMHDICLYFQHSSY